MPLRIRSMSKSPHASERQEQSAIVKLLRSIGAKVYVIGTTRRKGDYHGTCQTPGIPDLYCFLPARTRFNAGDNFILPLAKTAIWVEVKAQTGRMRPEQVAFEADCHVRQIPHLVGGVDTVVAWLRDGGWLK